MKIRELSVQQINAALYSLEKQIELLNKKVVELEKNASKKTTTVTTTTTTSNTLTSNTTTETQNGGNTSSNTEISGGNSYSPPDGHTAPETGN